MACLSTITLLAYYSVWTVSLLCFNAPFSATQCCGGVRFAFPTVPEKVSTLFADFNILTNTKSPFNNRITLARYLYGGLYPLGRLSTSP